MIGSIKLMDDKKKLKRRRPKMHHFETHKATVRLFQVCLSNHFFFYTYHPSLPSACNYDILFRPIEPMNDILLLKYDVDKVSHLGNANGLLLNVRNLNY